ncbi:hypothetical protein K3G63_04700 [Hymenobacter sp. HSC-4F20]|uniref:phage tail tube protein n=1 Tax=Hymenobacter sp. HSC-4F20 TaxID=2864135 RepID=UPI001C7315D8|nr:phage tail tube protein [Hymenobacter sp. HSC-4F20]MBX0289723.1 hypothetical protein [Hymenobacter sp. HSC-4F20]
MTDSSLTRHAYVMQSAYGAVPANPAFKKLRLTGGGLSEQSGYTTSNEIRSDRQNSDMRLTSREAGGDFPFEMSYESFDDLLAAFMCNNWATDTLKPGTLDKYFAYERTDNMGGGVFDYELFKNCQINTFNLSISPRSLMTGSFGVMASEMQANTAPITGSTYAEPPQTSVFSSAEASGELMINGAVVGYLMALTISGTNNMQGREQLFSPYLDGMRKGKFDFGGELTTYFRTKALRDLQRADGYVDLKLTIGNDTDGTYEFVMSRVKLANTAKNTPGNNEDVMLNTAFTANYDTTDGASLIITRIDATP